MVFDSVSLAYQFYKEYAKAAGFEIRKGTQRYLKNSVVSAKYFVCSKQGHKKFHVIDTYTNPADAEKKSKDKRRRSSMRTGCRAQIQFNIIENGKYKVQAFHEEHNHKFVDSDDSHLLKSSRKLSWMQQQTIHDLSKLNIGPVRAFNILRKMKGGFEDVGVTSVDCKNFKRDMNSFIGEFDADMVVRRLMRKKEFSEQFSFDYTVDDKGNLASMFWSDEDMRKNYSVFGDVVAFDATFRSNKYKMVFVPFTGIDNHNKNVTFAAALLSSETVESYTWLLKNFQSGLGSDPKVIVTDQDPSMKIAILDVFPNTRHRLCMWHIMKKLAKKVGAKLFRSKHFKTRLCKIVWTDAISILHFEYAWGKIISDFDLHKNKWLIAMYNKRGDWIPAYYRDEHMSGIMRTTSRSESENHFFGQFTSVDNTLVEFLSHFETAMECQRYQHRKNDHDTRYTTPEFKTDSILERQADKIYTRNVFYDVQEEIRAGLKECFCLGTGTVEDFGKFDIKETKSKRKHLFEVLFRESDMTLSCSCNHYEQYGLLCKHIFYVLGACEVQRFPEKYIMRRWTRDAVPNSSRDSGSNSDSAGGRADQIKGIVKEIMSSTEHIVNRLVTNFEELKLYRDRVLEDVNKVNSFGASDDLTKQKERYASLMGHDQNNHVHVGRPLTVKTKGSGSHKRYKSADEKGFNSKGKKKRKCHMCGLTGHNSRTCKNKNSNDCEDDYEESDDDQEEDDDGEDDQDGENDSESNEDSDD